MTKCLSHKLFLLRNIRNYWLQKFKDKLRHGLSKVCHIYEEGRVPYGGVLFS